MANGFTPATQSNDPTQVRLELATVLLALRRLRADLASGRLARDSQFLSIEQIDELLVSLCPPARRPQPALRRPSRLHRTEDPAAVAQRSSNSWNALAEAVG